MSKGWIFIIAVLLIALILGGISYLNIARNGFTISEAKVGRFVLEEDVYIGLDVERTEKITDVFENTSEDVVVKNFTDLNYNFKANDGKYIEEDIIQAMEETLNQKIILNAIVRGADREIDCRPSYSCWIEFTPEVRRVYGIYQKISLLTGKVKTSKVKLDLPVLDEDGSTILGKYSLRQERLAK